MNKLILFFLSLFCSGLSTHAAWMRYPAISPDGQNIVFSSKGDLWKVSSAGGRAVQLTSNPAYDFMPVWSPDGSKIAFASNRHGNFDVFVVDAQGGEPLRLTFHSSSDFPYSFSRDGKEIWFGSARIDDHRSAIFPSRILHEVYSVALAGGREIMRLSVPAENLQFSADGKQLLFHDRKGYEDPWRKHHKSSVTRDIILYDFSANTYRRLSDFNGEDRNPVWSGGDSYYFLSEKSGSFNVWKGKTAGSAYAEQITRHDTHPVRFLSSSADGKLCYGYDGEIYTITGGKAEKLNIELRADESQNELKYINVTGGVSEYSLSPNGKEIAFVYHGEVYVTSVQHTATKRITNTPEQERSVSFSPDGRKVLYAGERNASWNIYETEIVSPEEKYFYNSTLLNEKVLSAKPEEEFQPRYSPDGNYVAYLEERTTLKVLELASGKQVTAMDGNYSYSYSDGDQYFTWSPDSKWLLVEFFEYERWSTNVGLVSREGGKAPINLSKSGYANSTPKFFMDGEMVCWITDKYGYRSHGSWGSHGDVEAIFLSREAYRKFRANKMEAEYENEVKESKEKTEAETKKGETEKNKKQEKKEEIKPIRIEEEGLRDRRLRLTIHSSSLGDYLLNKDATQMFYMSSFEKGFDIWTTKFKENETKLLAKVGSAPSSISFDKEQKFIFYLKNGNLMKLEISSGTSTPIGIKGEFTLNASAERAFMFEHAWRQLQKKFYVADLHGVDWIMYKREYAKYLADINNGYDFAEMLSELLGEINASHTGATYRYADPNGDQTASLACFFDHAHQGEGYRIAEILPGSPLLLSGKITPGTIITAIDDTQLKSSINIHQLLNRKNDQPVLLSLKNGNSNWKEVVKPVSQFEEMDLSYRNWIKRCENEVERLSGGKIGYVHVRGMDSESFREVFEKALGELHVKDALIVDTRFNGGGWLHDDLATLLSGKRYMSFEPRGQKNMGGEPIWKWQKPSCVLMSEGNYSDAHLFPYSYKALGIGKLIGMPVPGTGTAVWWEFMIDGYTRFGIPQVGMRGEKENHLVENQELQPDIKVENNWALMSKGQDQQLEAAVKELLGK